MNLISPEKRQQVVALLIEGWSLRQVASRANVHPNTVHRYMRMIGMRRHNGHRSPIAYRHRNHSKEWYQRHDTKPVAFDEAAALELQWLAISPMRLFSHDSNLSLLPADWREGRRLLGKVRVSLAERRHPKGDITLD